MSVELLPPPVCRVEFGSWDRSVDSGWILPSLGDIALTRHEAEFFVPPGHEVLRTPAKSVSEIKSPHDFDRIIRKMTEAATAAKRTLAGIAAPQVGEPYQIIAVRKDLTQDDKELTWLYDPEVVDHSDAVYYDSEGCFSAYRVAGLVPRFEWVSVAAANLDKPLTLVDVPGERFNIGARVIQHEIDHINGIRHADRVTEAIAAGRLGPDAIWWTYSEHAPFFDKSKQGFPYYGGTPYLHHVQMLRTGQASHPWYDTLARGQWEAIQQGRLCMAV